MQILIDATLAGPKRAVRHGMYRYLKQLLLGLQAVDGGHQYRLWFNAFRRTRRDGVQDFLVDLPSSRVEAVISRFPARLRSRLGLPADWFTGPGDVFHSPNHLLPRLRRCPGIVTIHDLAFLRMQEDLTHPNPEWCRAIRGRSPDPAGDLAAYGARCRYFQGLQARIRDTLARADAILAVSEATAGDLVELCGVPRDRIRVVPNGLTPGIARVTDPDRLHETRRLLGVEGRYVLYVGTLDPNKNLSTLIHAFGRTSTAFSRDHRLVLAGPRNWFQPVLEREAERCEVEDRVRFLGFVPDSLLPALYSEAAAVVAPSPLEGFGFPVLEAMACGAPVIVAEAGALPEVAGEAAVRVPPHSLDALANAMERVATDSGLATDLRARGYARVREFSWERTAKTTLAVYEEVAR